MVMACLAAGSAVGALDQQGCSATSAGCKRLGHAAWRSVLSQPAALVLTRGLLQMAAAIKPAQKPGVEEAEAAPIHRIRITLTSRNVKNLEKGKPGPGDRVHSWR